MSQRYSESDSSASTRVRPFSALRTTFQEGYTLSHFRSDILAGLVVGLVALPLGLALAIATGVAPQYGLYTVIIAGFVVALLGGSRFQVSGPTAAFVVILAPIVQKYGLGGLLISGLMAGLILMLMGLLKLGRLIQFIPHTVTTGFTTGIAVVIASIQIKAFFGLSFSKVPESFIERLSLIAAGASGFSAIEAGIGFSTLMLLIFWPRITRKIPAPLVALGLVSVGAALLSQRFGFDYATIQNRYNGIPSILPQLTWPWTFGGPSNEPLPLSFEFFESLIPSAIAIALLGAIESLLSAVVADGMMKTRHDPDAELLALGTGNMIAPFFGGIAATGAIARTATNIRYGARSPIAAMTHSLFVLLVVLFFADWVAYLPMASLAALLIFVAYNMAELKHFTHISKVAPKSDVAVLWICFGLTVVFDMVIGVTVGVVLASLLFMRRMSTLTRGGFLQGQEHSQIHQSIPTDVMVYEISGPLFFGATRSAIDALARIDAKIRVLIFDMRYVSTMDVTGLIAFEETLMDLKNRQIRTILAGIQKQPLELLQHSTSLKGTKLETAATIDEALTSSRR